jgi:NADH dehydrogenase/NADH:ubiquinone oxidoreductase subunit G
VEEGITVQTDSEKVRKIRKMILELLLPIAPTGPIKDLASQYGMAASRFEATEEPPSCTLCGMCVRYCEEIVKKDAVGFVGRGTERKVTLLPERGNLCMFCRKCYTLCEGNRFSAMAES